MSRHTVEVKANTESGKAILVMGFDLVPNPHFFCYLTEHKSGETTPLWSSMFSLELQQAQEPEEFDEVMATFGVTVPPFIKKALAEDWLKQQMNVEYVWHPDGTMEQVR